MTRRALALLFAAGLLVAARSGPAHARTSPGTAKDDEPRRDGLVLGVAMGAATLKAGFGNGDGGFGGNPDISVGTAAADLQFGGMLHRRIALLFHLNLARGSEGAVQFLHASTLIGFRMFLTHVFWFELAAGSSAYQERDTIDGSTIEEHAHSFAWMLGGGIEIYRGDRFTLDVRANLGFAEYQNNFSASFLQGLIGLNWY